MEKPNESQVDQWIEHNLYVLLEKSMKEKQFPGSPAITTLIQMYHAIQLKRVHEELSNLWSLIADGEAGVYVRYIGGEVDVDVRKMPEEKPPTSPQPPSRVLRPKQNHS
jgi:hypothetical protein